MICDLDRDPSDVSDVSDVSTVYSRDVAILIHPFFHNRDISFFSYFSKLLSCHGTQRLANMSRFLVTIIRDLFFFFSL